MMGKAKHWLQLRLSPATRLALKVWIVRSIEAKSRLREGGVALWTRFRSSTGKSVSTTSDYSISAWDPHYFPSAEQLVDSAQTPRASIIIPVFNKADFTFQCLRSLFEEVEPGEIEVIVVNNASSDHTSEVLAHFGKLIQVVSNDTNLGFVEACNRGAAAARGEYLVFLNNDTLVKPGWLKHLIETIEQDEFVGAVGSMFIYPDGRIQEAGGIIWNSGAAHHYGWGKSADEPKYNFAREVDYCSAASLLVRTALFKKLGGFDQRYAPAYYEDVDLCFGVRSLGFKVVYQPFSRVVHFEGVTAGTDSNAGFRRFELINRQKFREKWAEVLKRDHLEQDSSKLEQAANRQPGLRILVCDDRVPAPDRDAGGARMFLVLQSLLKLGPTVFISMSDFQRPEHEQALRRIGVETAPWSRYQQLLKGRRFNIALLSRPEVAAGLLPPIRKASRSTKIIFDTVDISFIRLGRESRLTGDKSIAAAAARYQKLEGQLAREVDQVWCVTGEDVAALAPLAPEAHFEIVPTIHPLQSRGKGFAERDGLVFIGNYLHHPNEDAMHYFVRDVLPLVLARHPKIKVFIAGDNPSPELRAFASDDVMVTGYVRDVDELFHNCRVFVAPLRFGSGIKGKIGQALSYGVPVVTTSIGAEGMGFENGREAIVADSAQEFANAVCRVYQDAEIWQRLSDNGYEHVRRNFTPAVVEEKIHRAVLRCCKDEVSTSLR